ncbi:YueI family protein [Virgibacillus byunsanensis]|uniref:YueI family protein n=1 Tax=Virgibacillus byunsanensis TaxID=570945 RepID=A0ABW3LLS4_9BACI
MSKKDVDDYLTEGIYGARKPKQAERKKYLGTLRERIVIVLTKGQIMSDKGLVKLEEAMQKHPNTELLINGHVSYKFLAEEKALATKQNIPYTTITNEESDTDIGAVLTYDYAIDKKDIFIKEESEEEKNTQEETFSSRIKRWFT